MTSSRSHPRSLFRSALGLQLAVEDLSGFDGVDLNVSDGAGAGGFDLVCVVVRRCYSSDVAAGVEASERAGGCAFRGIGTDIHYLNFPAPPPPPVAAEGEVFDGASRDVRGGGRSQACDGRSNYRRFGRVRVLARPRRSRQNARCCRHRPCQRLSPSPTSRQTAWSASGWWRRSTAVSRRCGHRSPSSCKETVTQVLGCLATRDRWHTTSSRGCCTA